MVAGSSFCTGKFVNVQSYFLCYQYQMIPISSLSYLNGVELTEKNIFLLPIFQCIELYTTENDEQKVGFYSLEMAADMELEPKPYHVIAFEDPGDCKNLCYIIQAHMEMLGNGHAFVVARPPKVGNPSFSLVRMKIFSLKEEMLWGV